MHTHTQVVGNQRLIATAILFFIFMLAATFQSKAQATVTFGNKSLCDMIVKVTACNNTSTSTTVLRGAQVLVPVSDKVEFYEIFFVSGIAAITVFVGVPCTTYSVISNLDNCYVGFADGGDQSAGFTFDIW